MKMVDRKGGQKLNKVDRKTRKWTEKVDKIRKKVTEDSEWHPNDSQSDSQSDTQKAKNNTPEVKNWHQE